MFTQTLTPASSQRGRGWASTLLITPVCQFDVGQASMVTSRSTAKHRQQAERVGVDVYLTKPFSEDELLDHVAALHAACA